MISKIEFGSWSINAEISQLSASAIFLNCSMFGDLFPNESFLCIDLDNVSRDMREMFCRDFHDTYIETSQYGKGLYIFAKGKIAYNFNNQIKKVEMYQNNRCIVMTGNRVDGTSNNIIDKQSEIDRYYVVFCI